MLPQLLLLLRRARWRKRWTTEWFLVWHEAQLGLTWLGLNRGASVIRVVFWRRRWKIKAVFVYFPLESPSSRPRGCASIHTLVYFHFDRFGESIHNEAFCCLSLSCVEDFIILLYLLLLVLWRQNEYARLAFCCRPRWSMVIVITTRRSMFFEGTNILLLLSRIESGACLVSIVL